MKYLTDLKNLTNLMYSVLQKKPEFYLCSKNACNTLKINLIYTM